MSLTDTISSLWGTNPDEQQRQRLQRIIGLGLTPPTLAGSPYGAPSVPTPAAGPQPTAPNIPSGPQTSPLPQAARAPSSPNLAADAASGNVIAPVQANYKPQQSSIGRRALEALSVGMVGQKNPELASQEAQRFAAAPGLKAQAAFNADNSEFQNAQKQGIEARQAGEKVASSGDFQIDPATGKFDIPIGGPKVASAGTPEEATIHDLMTGESGQPRINPQTGKPFTYLEAFGAVKQAAQDVKPDRAPPVASAEDKAISDHLAAQGKPDTPANRDAARKDLKIYDRPPKEPTDNDTAISDYIRAKGLPDTPENRNQARIDLKLSEKGPNAQEVMRGDMAQNLNENLTQLEDIVNRRPDLFGPVAGRITGAKESVGTSDPDIAALKTIEDMMGRAQVSAHGMRNGSQVEKAANSILNSFHNSPAAIKSAIQAARNSVQTFTQNDEGKGGTTGSGGSGDTVTLRAPNGQTKTVSRAEAAHYKSLGATEVK